MTTTNAKQAAMELIQQLPDDMTHEDIMYELYFREAVDEGLRQAREGKLTPQSAVMREALEWLKSTTGSAGD
jgi:predicted transcriptional regulator